MYDRIFSDVKRFLSENDGEATKIGNFPFRKRSEHIWRVFVWSKRIIDGGQFDATLDRESVLIAALFHDVGYALSLDGANHAENSAKVFHDYALKTELLPDKRDFIEYLISHHSQKNLMKNADTPLELIILMEADLLDETGALSIVWDCMMEGSQDIQSFYKTYEHIRHYSGKILESNPMITTKAKVFWEEKQRLLESFILQLAFDLAVGE